VQETRSFSRATKSSSPAYAHDGDGHRTSAADGARTTAFRRNHFCDHGAGNSIAFFDDADGNTTSIAYSGVSSTATDNNYTIDQLAPVVDPAGKTTSFGCTAVGAPTTIAAANGTISTVAYNAADQPTSSALIDGTTGLGPFSPDIRSK
jgi:YD repeat-containing protein